MTTTSRVLKASSVLAISEVASNGCSLLRNLILARILTKEDFGIAATLALLVALFELAGKMSFGQQIARARAEEVEQFQASAQSCQLLAGVVGAVLMVIFAEPLSHWFDLSGNLPAFLLLATIPICSGFSSLDMYREVRDLRFTPVVLADVVPQILITVLAWPLAIWLKSYWAILWLLILKAVLTLIVSHAIAKRPFRLEKRWSELKASLAFGWPLLASGYLILAIFQGDRMIVASAFSMADLGVYAVAATLAVTPGLVILRITGSITMPALASAQQDDERFRRAYRSACQLMGLLAAVMNVIICTSGELLVVLLFGEKYREAAPLLLWLTIAQSLRIFRGASISAALAKGDSVNSLLANIARLSGLLIAWLCAARGLPMVWIAYAGIAGEIVALAASLHRGARRQGTPVRDCLAPFGLMVSVTAATILVTHWEGTATPTISIGLAVVSTALAVGIFILVFKPVREMTHDATLTFFRRLNSIAGRQAK